MTCLTVAVDSFQGGLWICQFSTLVEQSNGKVVLGIQNFTCTKTQTRNQTKDLLSLIWWCSHNLVNHSEGWGSTDRPGTQGQSLREGRGREQELPQASWPEFDAQNPLMDGGSRKLSSGLHMSTVVPVSINQSKITREEGRVGRGVTAYAHHTSTWETEARRWAFKVIEISLERKWKKE